MPCLFPTDSQVIGVCSRGLVGSGVLPKIQRPIEAPFCYAKISPCTNVDGKKLEKKTANYLYFNICQYLSPVHHCLLWEPGIIYFSVPGTVSFTGSVVGPISGCPDSNDAWATYQAIQATSCISGSVLAHHWMATS